MVVLEGHGTNPQMLSGTNGGPNQYLQPDYMSPLPTMLDAKKSPLALLVQTCSQIGADSSSKFETSSSSSSSSSSQNNKRKHQSINIETTSSPSSNRLNLQEFESLSNGRPRSSGSHSNSSSTSSNSSFHSKSTVIIANNGSNGSINNTTLNNNGKISPSHQGGGGRHKSTDSSNSTATSSSINGKHSPSQRSLKRATSSTSSIMTTSPVSSKMSRVSPPVSSSSSSTSSEKDIISSVSTTNSKKDHHHSSHHRSASKSPVGSEKPGRDEEKSKSSSMHHQPSDPQGSNPIIRSGLEILHGGGRLHGNHGGVPMPSSLSALSGYPPTSSAGAFSHEALLNPAFRLPFFGGPSPSQMFMGYPGQPGAGSSPYVSYSRVKTPSGAESIVPVCKDPYCTGCQFSPANLAGLMGGGGYPGMNGGAQQQGICPAGCAQCDHQKIPYSQAFAMGMGYPQALLSQHAALMQHHHQQQQHAALAAAQQQHQQQQQQQQHQQQQQQQQQNAQRPYVCNWIVGDNYCGKRFPNSEDLLQHLRTHPSSSSSPGGSADAAALAAIAAHQQQQLYSSALGLNPAAMAAAMQRAYPNSAAAAAQMNPYGKHGLVPQGYYPPPGPYSLYGQRVGPSVLPN